MKGLTPIILVIATAGIAFFYINPQYAKIGEIKAEHSEYTKASDKADELRELRKEFEIQYNNISTEDLARLEKILPSHVDNVRLITEMDRIASTYGISIREIDAEGDEPATPRRAVAATVPVGGVKPYNTAKVSFEFDASYPNFIRFISDLEKSLRVIDMNAIAIGYKEGVYSYRLTLQTYWVK